MVSTSKVTRYVDEEVEDAVGNTSQISQQSEPVDASLSQKESSTEPLIVNGGRRRGRRKVLKKKTIKDEEGYLGLYSPSSADVHSKLMVA